MPLASITTEFTSLVADYGLYAVFFLMAIDAVLPAASEVVMLYAGAVASGAFAAQHISLFGTTIESGARAYLAVALAGTLGYLVGSIGGWAMGRYGGRGFLERHGRLVHLPPEQFESAERWFERFGNWAVLVGRVTPVARSFVSIPAGVFRAPLGRYVVLTAIGSAVWSFALAGLGYGLGTQWERVHSDFRYLDVAVALALVALVVWLLLRRRKRAAAADAGSTRGAPDA